MGGAHKAVRWSTSPQPTDPAEARSASRRSFRAPAVLNTAGWLPARVQ